MDYDELAAWLRLVLTPGVGNDGARRLLAGLGLPQAIFSQSANALRSFVSAAQAQALAEQPPGLADLLARTWQWLQEGAAQAEGHAMRHIVTLGDPCYPAVLLDTPDPPLM
ncbi:MAG TPA: DNA-protecting protein DprA, partial [Burkholderiaceae bacterium]